jgi:protein-disulfide isomerase
MARLRYAVLLIAIFLVGCLGSGNEDVCTSGGDTAKLTKTEELVLGSNTFNYIRQVYLIPQGLESEFKSIEPYGEMYIINFTFGGRGGMPQTPVQAYVTSDGKLFLMNNQYCPIVDTTRLPEPTEAPAPTQAPEQLRVTVDIDDDYCLGQEDAPVTIVEFSDYQCPYCQRFWAQTLPQIKSEYIDTGKVKFIYRDFPLGFHPNAQKAAEATECAGDQEKYWDMHNKIFGQLNGWSGSGDAATIFKGYASDLELDSDAFADCLDTGKYEEEVQKDLAAGSAAGVSGTPAFFVNGIFIGGAQEFSTFKQIIESELAENGSSSTITGSCTGK